MRRAAPNTCLCLLLPCALVGCALEGMTAEQCMELYGEGGELAGEPPPPECEDAADANDDGAIDIADAIAVLSHLFAGAGPLPEPFGECGVDPTVDNLDCTSYEPCEL